jgi:hypothetical protein
MHSALSNNTLVMNTGLTFGDNTSPSNWEPIARAQHQLAQRFWHDEAIIARSAEFTVAIPDSQNRLSLIEKRALE